MKAPRNYLNNHVKCLKTQKLLCVENVSVEPPKGAHKLRKIDYHFIPLTDYKEKRVTLQISAPIYCINKYF